MAEHLDPATNDLVRLALEDLKARDMTQQQISDRLGGKPSQVQVGRLLRGEGGTTYQVARAICQLAGRLEEFSRLTEGLATSGQPDIAYVDPQLDAAIDRGEWHDIEKNAARAVAATVHPKWNADAWDDFLSTVKRIDRVEAQRRALADVLSAGIDKAENKRHTLERAEAARASMRTRLPAGTLTAPIVEYTRGRQAGKR